jgi:hypothetical protein
MTLLPKKGDPSHAANYRPIQLVNTDNKIFTRLLNHRIMELAPQFINLHQLGFMPGRFIADHGLLTQVIMENASNTTFDSCTALGLLLDQEKAYDRVNLEYLQTVLLRLGFPSTLIQSLYLLFQRNKIQINLNG